MSGPVLLIVLLASGTIYLFGYLRAVMHRANKDYKSTKAAVKPLRKNFWGPGTRRCVRACSSRSG